MSVNTVINIIISYIYIMVALMMSIIFASDYMGTLLYYNLTILISVLFASFAESSKSTALFNCFFTFSFLVLFFTLGFRNYTGIDDIAYINIFDKIVQDGWINQFKNTNMEIGYLILNAVVAVFTKDYMYMQLVTSFIPLALFYYAFRRYRNVISVSVAVFLLSTMIYFQMLSVSLIRMFIAISIVFNAFYYINKRKPIKYIFLILIASTFHYSALFMLILILININKGSVKKSIADVITVGLVLVPIAFLIVTQCLVPLMGRRYASYGDIGKFVLDISSFDTIPILILLFSFYKKSNVFNGGFFRLSMVVFMLSVFISFYGNMFFLGRVLFYSYLGLFIAAAMVSKSLNQRFERIIFCGIMIIYGFLYVYVTQFTLEPHIPHLFPYRNIFFTI